MNDASAPVSAEQRPGGPGVPTGPQTAPDGRRSPLPGAAVVQSAAPLDDERLAAIEARATHERVTPGPWRLDKEGCDCGGDYPCGHGLYVTGVVTPTPTDIALERCKRTGEQPRDYDFHRSDIGDFTDADWELMAHAREDVPALLAEVRRQRDGLVDQANADTVAARAAQVISDMGAEIRALTAERNRYRNAWHNARARAADTRDDVEFVERAADEQESGNGPCGHTDYHDSHEWGEWGDRPGVWCPGISYTDDEAVTA
jgi:hypothetical protein